MLYRNLDHQYLLHKLHRIHSLRELMNAVKLRDSVITKSEINNNIKNNVLKLNDAEFIFKQFNYDDIIFLVKISCELSVYSIDFSNNSSRIVTHACLALQHSLSNLSSINIAYVKAEPEDITHLLSLFKVKKNINMLNLSGHYLKEEHLNQLVDLLNYSSTLNSLYIDEIHVSNKEIQYILHAVEQNKNLTSLSLKYNRINDLTAKIIAKTLCNSKLIQINLAGNFINDSGITEITNSLKYNCSLTSLDVSYNHFSVAGFSAIAQMLEANCRINIIECYDYFADIKILNNVLEIFANNLRNNISIIYIDLLSCYTELYKDSMKSCNLTESYEDLHHIIHRNREYILYVAESLTSVVAEDSKQINNITSYSLMVEGNSLRDYILANIYVKYGFDEIFFKACESDIIKGIEETIQDQFLYIKTHLFKIAGIVKNSYDYEFIKDIAKNYNIQLPYEICNLIIDFIFPDLIQIKKWLDLVNRNNIIWQRNYKNHKNNVKISEDNESMDLQDNATGITIDSNVIGYNQDMILYN